MKKIILATLLLLALVFTLALPIMAEDPAETTASDMPSTETTAEVTETEDSTEETTEAAPKTSFGFYPGTLGETLPIMGMGMLGIFLVIGTIALTVVLLSKLPNKKED